MDSPDSGPCHQLLHASKLFIQGQCFSPLPDSNPDF